MRQYYIYIMSNKKNGTIYVGVTNDLVRRVSEHKNGLVEGFTKKHALKNLVYFEPFDSIEGAIVREKQLKKWNRAWKMRLIQQTNMDWHDLFAEIVP